MSTRSALLLSIGTLVLGLVLGLATGGVAGFFAGQSTSRTLSQNVRPFQSLPNSPQNPQQLPQNPQQPQQPQNPQQPVNPGNPRNPQNPRGGGNVPPAQNIAAGARITDVDPTSPAATAGLQAGDTITAIDNTPLDATHSLGDLISAHKPGDKVALAVTRGNQTLTLNITLGQSPNDNTSPYMGIRFAPVTGGTQNPRFQNPGGTPRFQNPGGNLPNG